MMGKLPFESGIFWKILVVIAILVVVAWAVYLKFSDYRMGAQDYVGSVISGVLFSYLLHLWMLPGEFEEDFDTEVEEEDA